MHCERMSSDYRPARFRIHPAVTSLENTGEQILLAALSAHTVTLAPLCLTDDVVCFRSSWFHLPKVSKTVPAVYWQSLI